MQPFKEEPAPGIHSNDKFLVLTTPVAEGIEIEDFPKFVSISRFNKAELIGVYSGTRSSTGQRRTFRAKRSGCATRLLGTAPNPWPR